MLKLSLDNLKISKNRLSEHYDKMLKIEKIMSIFRYKTSKMTIYNGQKDNFDAKISLKMVKNSQKISILP